MNTFKKILFFADGAKGETIALQRAAELALHNKASLTVMDVVAEVDSNDARLKPTLKRLQQALIKERKTALEALVKELFHEGGTPSIKIHVAAGKNYIGVIQTIIQKRFDLLVKSANKHNAVAATLFGNTDISLLRKCPCPVWIIKPSRKKRIDTILAAVDLTETSEAQQLARQILNLSAGLANLEKSDLHVLNAWQPNFEPHVRTLIGRQEYADMMKMLKENSHASLRALIQSTADLPVNGAMSQHLEKGHAEVVIPKFVKDHKIDLLIMGTMSRTGIPGFLIGNTAEKVLDAVDCSVLTLKPSGFKSPVA
ncbi:MAG: universal stress protein [SAR86 cluster bacterium]|jgi:universal stress protein E|tara:strand:- start:16418 stop:17353 length:936 start_codon:yes stop_codon:yes gene_type:complete